MLGVASKSFVHVNLHAQYMHKSYMHNSPLSVTTDGNNNNDAVSSSDVVGIFIDVVVGSKMILMLTFILVGAVSSASLSHSIILL